MNTSTDSTSFSELSLAPELLSVITRLGYNSPTPVQQQAIPEILANRDVMAKSQTGTGKTAAFTLPILQKLLPQANTSTSPARHPIKALILTPTRELAIQVAQCVTTYGAATALRSTVIYGGVDIKTQTPALIHGVEILVATPGRLLDHVEQRTLQLNQVQILVLDEADKMLDMGFLPDLKRIIALLPAQRQNLLFSATFSDEIKRLANEWLNHAVEIEIKSNAQSAHYVQQVWYRVSPNTKAVLLKQILSNTTQAIIFTKTKLSANMLTDQLKRLGIKANSIHGDKTQQERLIALEAFKQNEITALVATDVAARGLDIDQLPLVINYELPHSAEDYVHRIGRTGRAGAYGKAISLVAPREEKYLREIEQYTRIPIKEESLSTSSGTPAVASDLPWILIPKSIQSSPPLSGQNIGQSAPRQNPERSSQNKSLEIPALLRRTLAAPILKEEA